MRFIIALLGLSISSSVSPAGVVLLSSPSQISNPTTINFEGYPDRTIANTLYQPQGITFTRDDGRGVFLMNWTQLSRFTTSPVNVIATISGPGVPSYVSHLNVTSGSSLFAVGAFFGNDQTAFVPLTDFTTIRLTAFGLSNQSLGSVSVLANQNTSVDQFIGLSSDLPISRVRFENLSNTGNPSQFYSVVLDDLVFSTTVVPEPSSLTLVALGMLVGFVLFRRGSMRPRFFPSVP
jgi:hypothetical protein